MSILLVRTSLECVELPNARDRRRCTLGRSAECRRTQYRWVHQVCEEADGLDAEQFVLPTGCRAGDEQDGCAKLVRKPAGWMTNNSGLAVAVSRRCSSERLPREGLHEHSETNWQDTAMEKCSLKLLKASRAQLMLRGVLCTLEVGDYSFQGRTTQRCVGQNHRTMSGSCWC